MSDRGTVKQRAVAAAEAKLSEQQPCALCAMWKAYADEYRQQLKDATSRLVEQRRELARVLARLEEL